MNIKSFFKLVEIQTKVASVIPFTTGVIYSIYKYNRFDITTVLLFFLSMISIDMATTAINNYLDYKKAIKKDGYNYQEHNAMVRDNVSNKSALSVIFILLTLASFFGIVLVVLTDWVVLLAGVISFIIGITYSFGPLPLSRTPLGEIFSGLTMGGVITFIAIYIQIPDFSIIGAIIIDNKFVLNIKYIEFFSIVLVTLPNIFMISNIMLANNICDIDDDKENNRFTLPIYIGKKAALIIFSLLYFLSYVTVVIGVVLNVFPIITMITLVTIIPLVKNIKNFWDKSEKATTFVLAVKNFVLFSLVLILSLVLGIFI